MRIKYLAFIEMAVLIIAFIPTVLFYLLYLPFYLGARGFGWIYNTTQHWKFKLGNWLLRHSYEAKNGKIRNKAVLRNMTAYDVHYRYGM